MVASKRYNVLTVALCIISAENMAKSGQKRKHDHTDDDSEMEVISEAKNSVSIAHIQYIVCSQAVQCIVIIHDLMYIPLMFIPLMSIYHH